MKQSVDQSFSNNLSQLHSKKYREHVSIPECSYLCLAKELCFEKTLSHWSQENSPVGSPPEAPADPANADAADDEDLDDLRRRRGFPSLSIDPASSNSDSSASNCLRKIRMKELGFRVNKRANRINL